MTKDKVRLSYACIMVEVDASNPLKEFIMLKGLDSVLQKQSIEYEFRPFHCTKCMKFGHTAGRCPTAVMWIWQRRVDDPAIGRAPAQVVSVVANVGNGQQLVTAPLEPW